MEKNITLTSKELGMEVPSINIKRIIGPLEWLRKYYSSILEKEISMKQTLLLIETQAAFAASIIPADINLLLRAAFIGWFAYSLLRCKHCL